MAADPTARQQPAEVPPPPSGGKYDSDSLDAALKELQTLHQTQLTILSGLSTRAGTALGALTAAIVALAVASRTTLGSHYFDVIPGVAVFAIAAGLAIRSFIDEVIDVGPDENDVALAAAGPSSDVKVALINVYTDICFGNGRIVMRRGKYLQAALITMGIGVVVLVVCIAFLPL